jgi:hypothetical protein
MVRRRGNGAGAAVLLIAAAGCSSGHHSGRSQRPAQTGIRCGTKLGGPPPGASLQARKHAVVLYLPKYCLLDRKVTRQLRAGKSH